MVRNNGARASLIAYDYFLPEVVEDNDYLDRLYPNWQVKTVEKKTRIFSRHIAEEGQCASDLAVGAAQKLLARISMAKKSDIDYIIFCTQSPDFFLPASACIIQEQLGLGSNVGAIDVNQGCSGYVYSLGLAKGLIESNQAKHVLVLTGDTYSKYINERDRSVRCLFGDAGTATLVGVGSSLVLNEFVYGTDGSGASNLIVRAGGSRLPIRRSDHLAFDEIEDSSGNFRSLSDLYMNGGAVFEFSIKRLKEVFSGLASKGVFIEEVDFFIFHQANYFMLEAIRRSLKLPQEKCIYQFSETGNTVSSSIPLAMSLAEESGSNFSGKRILLVGFGVGYSWAAVNIN